MDRNTKKTFDMMTGEERMKRSGELAKERVRIKADAMEYLENAMDSVARNRSHKDIKAGIDGLMPMFTAMLKAANAENEWNKACYEDYLARTEKFRRANERVNRRQKKILLHKRVMPKGGADYIPVERADRCNDVYAAVVAFKNAVRHHIGRYPSQKQVDMMYKIGVVEMNRGDGRWQFYLDYPDGR